MKEIVTHGPTAGVVTTHTSQIGFVVTPGHDITWTWTPGHGHGHGHGHLDTWTWTPGRGHGHLDMDMDMDMDMDTWSRHNMVVAR